MANPTKAHGSQMETVVSSIPPSTVDLPSSASTPAKIDLSGDMVAGVYVRSVVDWHWTDADTDALGLSQIADDTTRFTEEAGHLYISVSILSSKYLYCRSQASASTKGLSYKLVVFAR